MPFDINGVFSRLYNFVADRDASIQILAERVDGEVDNIVDAINDIASGQISWLSPIRATFGTALLPSYTFTDDPDTGMYRSDVDALGFSTGGSLRLEIKADGLEFLGNEVWHAGNDGVDSGLDADLLDGIQGADYATRQYVIDTYMHQPSAIGGGADLNTLWGSGWRAQETAEDAATGTNYPDPLSGILASAESPNGDVAAQTYWAYDGDDSYLAFRLFEHASGATPWQKVWTNITLKYATTEVFGYVELATSAEATAGTDATRAITPFTLEATLVSKNYATETYVNDQITTLQDSLVPDAAEGVKGKAAIATQVTVDAGTDDTEIVTPLKLAGAFSSFLTGQPFLDALAGRVVYEEFTASGTWTKPDLPDGSLVIIYLVGGGAGGGYFWDYAGGAGGDGAVLPLRLGDLGASESVIVGAGGLGGDTLNDPGHGGDSTFAGKTVRGGKAGIAAGGYSFKEIRQRNLLGLGAEIEFNWEPSYFGGGRQGGLYPDSSPGSGDGGTADDGFNSIFGGGGGARGFVAGTGAGGTSLMGGKGGDTAENGTAPGGGGGGYTSSAGDGARGVVRIWVIG